MACMYHPGEDHVYKMQCNGLIWNLAKKITPGDSDALNAATEQMQKLLRQDHFNGHICGSCFLILTTFARRWLKIRVQVLHPESKHRWVD